MIFAVSQSHLLDVDLYEQLTSWGLPQRAPQAERRLLKRLECSFVVEIPELEQSFEGINLSLAGILFHFEDWVLSGATLDILLHLPGGTDAIALRAKAISHTKRDEKRAVRVRFLEPDSESLQSISRWMLSKLN